jgi:hypothetical protein
MGTAPQNFPPDQSLAIGQLLTGNKLGLTGTLAQTVFFTAPGSGLYLVAMALQIVSTNAAGTLAAVMTTPHAGAIAQGVAPAAPGDTQVAIEQDLATGGPTDGFSAAIPVWMNTGDQIKVATTASGLTGTTYNIFVTALRAF